MIYEITLSDLQEIKEEKRILSVCALLKRKNENILWHTLQIMVAEHYEVL
jgi:hypothetical protein